MIDRFIGRTPTVRLRRVVEPHMAEVWVKIEGMNPGGSIKDRPALAMIRDAEDRGILSPGDTIVEPTSGNTGIGLAQVASARGYRLILCLPSSMSMERKRTLRAYGADLVLTDPERRMLEAIQVVAVEPGRSAVMHGEPRGQHRFQGMGPGFLPDNLDRSVIDRVKKAWEEQAFPTARRLAREEGLFVGMSSGGIVQAALEVARELGPDARVACIAPDSGSRYLTTDLYGEDDGAEAHPAGSRGESLRR